MTSDQFHHNRYCSCCTSKDIEPVLSLGYIPLVNQAAPNEEDPILLTFELSLDFCNNCGLVQLRYAPDAKLVFPPEYPYTSGMTKALKENFADLCREVGVLLQHTTSGFVVDIGSNDGTLLSYFKNAGYYTLGVEPTNTACIAQRNGISTKQQYFNTTTARSIVEERGQANLITCANCFAHMDSIYEVMGGVNDLLAPKGVFVTESHYLMDLINGLQYDTIYHEHLRYYSLGALMHLFELYGMEIFHVTRIPTHGGSIRVYSARNGDYPVDQSVGDLFDAEPPLHVQKAKLQMMGKQWIPLSKMSLHKLLYPYKASGSRIVGVGAPSRATTLINYVGLDANIINYVCELEGSLKIGTVVPGTQIPIVDEKRLFEEQPEVAIIFSWHIAQEIASNLRKKGYKGELVTPLPTPKVVLCSEDGKWLQPQI